MNRTINSLIESNRQWVMLGTFWHVVLACYLVVLGFLSLNPWARPASGDELLSPDKIEHAFAYGGLAIVVFFCLTKARNGYIRNTSRAWIAALLIAVLIGILMEAAQSVFTDNRAGSAADAAANAIGAVVGYIAYRSAEYIRSKTAA